MVPSFNLGGDTPIPQLGFGVFQIPPDETARAVTLALEAGYRHIDTAAAYRNEKGVAEALAASGVPREDVFVTTKLWNNSQGREEARTAFGKSAGRLGVEVVDLYLIHWPFPSKDRYVETWETLVELQQEGRIRAIGVSNFLPEHLERIIDATGVVPAVNQIELHPRLQQPELRDFHDEHGIVTEAWSPLAQGALLDDPVITGLAERYERTPAQIVLRWHVQLGNIVIPKSVTPERIAENIALFDFALDDDAMDAIEGLDRGERIGPDPAVMAIE
jgi:diketogulonate reductase-like aldo/keto reductase